MDFFNFTDQQLHAEDVNCHKIAEQYGTPCFVYSRATIERHYRAFEDALQSRSHLICYAVKANSNLAVLNVLAKLGSGFDIVSGGELARVIQAGGDAKKVVFSGVGKSFQEINAGLDAGIKCFNVESESELKRIAEIAAARNEVAPISIRVNPNVDAGTHPYISTGLKENKFGIELEKALPLFIWAQKQPSLSVQGVDCHIGSQLTDIAPFIAALDALIVLIKQLAEEGIELGHLDLGGGLGVPYNGEVPPHPSEYAAAVVKKLSDLPNLTIIFEPGRAIMANAGILLTKVEYLKHNADKHFCIVDAAMNDLIRPALYSAWQKIEVIDQRDIIQDVKKYDVVGPICETGDFIGKDRDLSVDAGDILAVRSAGAYGFTMSSNYNSRPRVAEIMVDGDKTHLIRKRETIESLWQGESVLAD